MIHYLQREQIIPAPLEQIWDYFATPANLNEMTPSDMKFEIIAGGDRCMYAGQMIEYRVQFVRGLRSLWLTEIVHVEDGRYFVDEQRVGPYRFWYHEHMFKQVESGVKMTDKVTYAVPLGLLGDWLNALWIRERLAGVFDYRQEKIKELFGAS